MPGAIRPQREARMGAMPDTMQPVPFPSVYQLRVVVHGVSPLIWRRLLVRADTTIAGLHARCCRPPSAGRARTCTGSSSRVASTASGMSVVPASVMIRGGFGWAILACDAPNDSPITTC